MDPQANSSYNFLNRCASESVCVLAVNLTGCKKLFILLPYYQSNWTPIKILFCRSASPAAGNVLVLCHDVCVFICCLISWAFSFKA